MRTKKGGREGSVRFFKTRIVLNVLTVVTTTTLLLLLLLY